jgi:hypothetical protein
LEWLAILADGPDRDQARSIRPPPVGRWQPRVNKCNVA